MSIGECPKTGEFCGYRAILDANEVSTLEHLATTDLTTPRDQKIDLLTVDTSKEVVDEMLAMSSITACSDKFCGVLGVMLNSYIERETNQRVVKAIQEGRVD